MRNQVENRIRKSVQTLAERQQEREERRFNKNRGRRDGTTNNRKVVSINRKDEEIKENLEKILTVHREKIHAVEIFKLLGI